MQKCRHEHQIVEYDGFLYLVHSIYDIPRKQEARSPGIQNLALQLVLELMTTQNVMFLDHCNLVLRCILNLVYKDACLSSVPIMRPLLLDTTCKEFEVGADAIDLSDLKRPHFCIAPQVAELDEPVPQREPRGPSLNKKRVHCRPDPRGPSPK